MNMARFFIIAFVLLMADVLKADEPSGSTLPDADKTLSLLSAKQLSQSSSKEESPMSGLPDASRIPPPDVPPVEYKGIRYAQEMQGLDHGFDQATGYLVAYDVKTNEQLWAVKVYEVETVPGLEPDVQWIYFKSMSLVPGRDELLIENEVGGRYIVDLEKHTSVPAP
jgi:hypothetical protein